ncbi:hypothetical protein [Oceanobacillus sp. 1P07AA]|uniref:hypothetical protein n=1 Tax=Oceanobacillus sp. 1P07AA TaxID=3132293 RepID=UPI0039A69EF3
MKKVLFLVLLSFLMISLAACGSDSTQQEEASAETENEESKKEDESVEVDKNLLSVEVNIPASMIESSEETIANAEEEGLEVTENEDGSLTYKMSKSKHKEIMDEIKTQLNQTTEEITSSGDYPSVQNVTANDDFSEFTMVVDQEKYENSMDGFAAITLGFSGMFYQLYDGVSEDDYNIIIYVENENGEVFNTINYPEDMESDIE